MGTDLERSRGMASGKVRIAYEIVGSGPDVLVVTPPWVSHLDYDWEVPWIRAYYQALAQGRRLIRYDKRGTGLSERTMTPEQCSPEVQMCDCLAVLDDAGVARASFLVISEGGPMAISLAATHPDRVERLVLYGSYARLRGGPEHPIGRDEERPTALISLVRSEWGLGSRVLAAVFIPEADPAQVAWFSTYQRIAATAEVAVAFLEAAYRIDVRHLLPAVSCPVLVAHRRQDHVIPFAQAEYLATHLPHATLCALDGEHHIPFFGDAAAVTRAVNRFLCPPGAPTPLSAREREVLALVADGLSNRAIAGHLSLSEATVNRHLANIFTKAGVTSRAAAVAYAFRSGLISAGRS